MPVVRRAPQALTPMAAAQAEVERCVEVLYAKTGKRVQVDQINWSNKMSKTWGVASVVGSKTVREYHIKLASTVFTTDSRQLRETVAHEVAHLADLQLYGGWGHGATWARVMRMLGQVPTRCVTAEEIAALGVQQAKRTVTKYVYTCGCQQHLLAGQTHNKIQRDSKTYKCNACNGVISFANKTVKA